MSGKINTQGGTGGGEVILGIDRAVSCLVKNLQVDPYITLIWHMAHLHTCRWVYLTMDPLHFKPKKCNIAQCLFWSFVKAYSKGIDISLPLILYMAAKRLHNTYFLISLFNLPFFQLTRNQQNINQGICSVNCSMGYAG